MNCNSGTIYQYIGFDEALKKGVMFKDAIMCSCAQEQRHINHFSCFIKCGITLSSFWFTEPETTLNYACNTVANSCMCYLFIHCFQMCCLFKPLLNSFFELTAKWDVLDLWDCFHRGENKRELTPWPFSPKPNPFLSCLITSYYPIWQPFES